MTRETQEETGRKLAELMSQISERAFCASWMDGLEYELWEAVEEGPKRYGQIELSDEEINELRRLAEKCGGWVRFGDLELEEFVPVLVWKEMYRKRKESK